jgi:predicted nucleic-acid-binding Zn-ribbon protein
MNAKVQVCPKCQGNMVQGFVVDFAAAQAVVSSWVEGPPEKSVWYGTKVPQAKCIPIGTFRCAACGYLESYARPEFGRQ